MKGLVARAVAASECTGRSFPALQVELNGPAYKGACQTSDSLRPLHHSARSWMVDMYIYYGCSVLHLIFSNVVRWLLAEHSADLRCI